MTKAVLAGRLALCAVMVALGFAGALRADVYSDAHLWLRGMARDANGNGTIEKTEFVNALGGTNLVNAGGGVYGGVTLTNAYVKYPMANITRYTSYLHFDQRVVWNDETEEEGTYYPANLKLDGVLSGFGNEYSFVVRFRNDTLPLMNNNWNWIVNFGYTKDRGVMLGLNGSGSLRLFSYTTIGVDVSGSLYQSITNGHWYDVGVSVKGTNITMMTSCENDYPGKDEVDKVFKSTYLNKSFRSDLSLVPLSSLVLGSENAGSTPLTYYKDLSKNTSNSTKSFRGDIQNFACWRRALTKDELREAMAWPRLEAFRVGVEDGTPNEFTGTADPDGAEPEGLAWKFPRGFSAHDSAKIKFVREDKIDATLPQILRFKTTAGSAQGQFSATVNGSNLGSRPVLPGRTATWYVPGSVFTATTQNVLTLTRTDSGAGAVVPDAVVLGGSWQLGKEDSRYLEFIHEGSGNVENWVIDGNTRNYRRALLGAGSDNTNSVMHFSLPADLAGRYDGRLSWRHSGNGGDEGSGSHMTVDYDGVQMMDVALAMSDKGKVFTLELPCEQLGPGDHVLTFRNGQGQASKYFSPDFVRFEIGKPKNGTMLLLR